MGKSSLIIVLGVSAIVAFFVLKLNGNSKENLSNTVDMFEKTQARLIANTGIEIYLEKLYANPALINTTSSEQDLFNGSYIVNLSGALPDVRVTSTATFGDVTHTSVADAHLEPISFPNLPGSLYISSEAVVTAKEVGDMNVNGSNHNPSGVVAGTGKPAVWGIGVDSDADRTAILAALKKPGNIQGLINSLTGDIGSPSVGVSGEGVDWAKIYQYLSNAADQTFINDIPDGADLGTLSDPKITLVNAEANYNKSIVINNGEGSGILVVNGNVKFAGGFTYKGIILCYKNTDLTYESAGNNLVIGGIIAAGKSVNFKLSGTMDVKYSQEVINTVKTNLKSNGFTILSWYE
ncbi:MAG: hypothetical protein ACM34O_12075 [Ignavibacteria bacterium]